MLVLSCPFAVVAAVSCDGPDEMPQYDSNFYSTISQMFLGVAGILAIIAPILTGWFKTMRVPWRRGHRKYDIMDDDKKIKTKNPLLFHSLIVLSCVTLLASAVVYPYHPLSSIPVAWAAGIAQKIATLLIIQDTGNRIMEQVDMIEDLEHRLANQG